MLIIKADTQAIIIVIIITTIRVIVIIVILINMLMPVKQKSVTHLRVLLVLTYCGTR
jgi:type IV secretory pathway component VirB8